MDWTADLTGKNDTGRHAVDGWEPTRTRKVVGSNPSANVGRRHSRRPSGRTGHPTAVPAAVEQVQVGLVGQG
jgi:hypothetical protein